MFIIIILLIISENNKDRISIIISVQIQVKLNENPLRVVKLIINFNFNCYRSLVCQSNFSKANTQLVIEYLNQIQKLR